MKKIGVLLLFSLLLILAFTVATAQATDQENACWGQASAVFAQMGEMGTHSSEQPTPRLGLYNLAVALYEQGGVLEEPSLQALGGFVANELGLSIEACM
jgi:hypothetical protein